MTPETATRSRCQACTPARLMGTRHPLSPTWKPTMRAKVGCAWRGHAGSCHLSDSDGSREA